MKLRFIAWIIIGILIMAFFMGCGKKKEDASINETLNPYKNSGMKVMVNRAEITDSITFGEKKYEEPGHASVCVNIDVYNFKSDDAIGVTTSIMDACSLNVDGEKIPVREMYSNGVVNVKEKVVLNTNFIFYVPYDDINKEIKFVFDGSLMGDSTYKLEYSEFKRNTSISQGKSSDTSSEDISYSGNIDVKKNAESGTVAFKISKDGTKVTYFKLTFNGIAFSVQSGNSTTSVSIGSISTEINDIPPITNGEFTIPLSDGGVVKGKIEAADKVTGSIHYIYNNYSSDNPIVFDIGDWTWTASQSLK